MDYIIWDLINLVVPITIACVAIVFVMLFFKRTKMKMMQERLEFTSKEIEIALKKIEAYPQFQGLNILPHNHEDDVFVFSSDFMLHAFTNDKAKRKYMFSSEAAIKTKETVNSLYSILSVFNKIALAVEQGIYDAHYVEITIGREMRIIYKKSLESIRQMRKGSGDDELFLAIELLIYNWDKYKDGYGRRVMKRGRYL